MNEPTLTDKIIIRPSSLGTFVSCQRQWYETFILGNKTIPNARAAIGTGVHAGAEVMWREAMQSKKKKPNLTAMLDASMDAYNATVKEADGEMTYDEGANDDTCRATIRKGVQAYVDDITPFVDIPTAVETRFTVEVDHPMVESVSGTVDYLRGDTLADIKTSKKKIVPQSHVLQQSTYAMLVQASGQPVNNTLIQGVVFTSKETTGSISRLDANIAQAEYILNMMLKKLEALHKGVDPDLLFTGNPKNYLCSEKYCSQFFTCPYTTGITETPITWFNKGVPNGN